jgi:hypothetical protein
MSNGTQNIQCDHYHPVGLAVAATGAIYTYQYYQTCSATQALFNTAPYLETVKPFVAKGLALLGAHPVVATAVGVTALGAALCSMKKSTRKELAKKFEDPLVQVATTTFAALAYQLNVLMVQQSAAKVGAFAASLLAKGAVIACAHPYIAVILVAAVIAGTPVTAESFKEAAKTVANVVAGVTIGLLVYQNGAAIFSCVKLGSAWVMDHPFMTTLVGGVTVAKLTNESTRHWASVLMMTPAFVSLAMAYPFLITAGSIYFPLNHYYPQEMQAVYAQFHVLGKHISEFLKRGEDEDLEDLIESLASPATPADPLV